MKLPWEKTLIQTSFFFLNHHMSIFITFQLLVKDDIPFKQIIEFHFYSKKLQKVMERTRIVVRIVQCPSPNLLLASPSRQQPCGLTLPGELPSSPKAVPTKAEKQRTCRPGCRWVRILIQYLLCSSIVLSTRKHGKEKSQVLPLQGLLRSRTEQYGRVG